jgi:hypothetical protein
MKNWIAIKLCSLLLLCCENNSQDFKNEERINNVSAIVVYHGSPAVDGCGWLIHQEKDVYAPLELDSDFMKDSLEVVLSYKILQTYWTCGWREPGYKNIDIIKIKNQ